MNFFSKRPKHSPTLGRDTSLLHKSPLLDPIWYRETYADLRATPIDVARHYLEHGAREGRNPHPLFDTNFYLERYPDVAETQLNPLVHYILFGGKERRDPHPLFDTNYYLAQVSEPQTDELTPLEHYLLIGRSQGVAPHPSFNDDEDVAPSGLRFENRDAPSTEFYEFPSGNRSGIDFRDWQVDVPLASAENIGLQRPIGIFVHLYYDALADEVARRIANIDLPKKIYISTDTEEKRKSIVRTFERYDLDRDVLACVAPNIGYDIAPLIVQFREQLAEHEICLKLHGKRSLHNSPEFGERWRSYLFDELVGDRERVRAIVAAMSQKRDLGFVMARHWEALNDWIGIGGNYAPMKSLLANIQVDLAPYDEIEYPSGSMFWFRGEALSRLLDLNLGWIDFTHAANARDATLAHAVERSFLFFGVKAGFKWGFLPQASSAVQLTPDEEQRLISESGLFDREYYLQEYEDVRSDPLEHWVSWGCAEGRRPSPDFDPKYYALSAKVPPGVNPLVHYIQEGRAKGLRTTRPERVTATVTVDNLYAAYRRPEQTEDYVREAFPAIRRSDVKLIAFYFPQFHPFPENDKFWGRGFTEWTNTTKAVPMFKGHYQPRLPDELGFYDTRLKEVLARQIDMAKQYGVYGLCLHHYFFEGKPVMRAPYNHLLANPDLQIPFCLHWANEPWTVRWDGLATKTGMLLNQRHSPKDDLAFFEDIAPAVADPRYITVDGRPLLIIYRPGLFPDIAATLDRWRECFVKAGLPPPYMAVMQTGFEGVVDPRQYGFDAAIEYPPHNIGVGKVTHQLDLYDPGFGGNAYDYEYTLERALVRPRPEYRQFRGIMPEWDCTPRRTNPDLYVNCAPHRYQRWLEGLCRDTDDARPSDEKLIFINAWNEWAEGAYLEPDRRYGYAYLDATARALNNYRPADIDQFGLRILIGAHIFYTDLIDEFIERFNNIPGRFDLFVTTSADQRAQVRARLEEGLGPNLGALAVHGVENVGRDFAPFILNFLPGTVDYDLCCWVHSKKSPYDAGYANWRKYLLNNLLGARQNIHAIVDAFAASLHLGLVYPKAFPPVADKMEWGSNFALTSELLERLEISVNEDVQPVFPTAAMFWFRPGALRGLLDLGLTLEDFVRFQEGPRDPASGHIVDGTISHALERMILYVAKAAGYDSREILFES